MPRSDCAESTIIPVDAAPFEDFIDGYFPLGVSLGHLLERRGFVAAWIIMRVAPMMDIPGLPPDSPVPLYLDPLHGGQIDWLAASVRHDSTTTVFSGQAIWRWNAAERVDETELPASVRLAEPAFLRGIGFPPGDLKTRALGCVARSVGRRSIALELANRPLSESTANRAQIVTRGAFSWDLCHSQTLKRLTPDQFVSAVAEPQISPMAIERLFLCDSANPITARILSDARPPAPLSTEPSKLVNSNATHHDDLTTHTKTKCPVKNTR